MPLKLNVGLSKKVGLPRYGSLGAACHLEIELAGDLLMNDPQAFQRHVRNAYTACREAVELELARRNGLSAAEEQPTTGAAGANRGTNGHVSGGQVSAGPVSAAHVSAAHVSANRDRANRRQDANGHDTNGHDRDGHDRDGHARSGHLDTPTGDPGDVDDTQDQVSDQDPDTSHPGPASHRQYAYIRRLAAEIQSLGMRRLDAFVLRMFDKPLAKLSSLDASNLIDALKAIGASEGGADVPLGKAAS